MIVNFRVKLDETRFSRLLTNVSKLASREFLENIELSRYSKLALQEFRKYFPVSTKDRSRKSVDEIQSITGYDHLIKGFATYPIETPNSVGFAIEHRFKRHPRINQILRAVDEGTPTVNFILSATSRFPSSSVGKALSGRQGSVRTRKTNFGLNFVSLKAGESVSIPPRAGVKYTSKTLSYINNVLLPQIKSDIRLAANKIVES